MRIERRGVGIVLAVVAAVAVVAIAARGDHVADGGAWSISATVSGTAQAMVLILLGVLALAVLALTVWAIFPDGRRKLEPRRRTSSIVSSIIFMLLIATAFSQVGRGDDGDKTPASRPSDLGAVPPVGDDGDPRPSPQWGLGLGGVVLLLAVAGVVALGRRGDELDLPDDPRPAVVSEEERVDAIAEAQRCTDPRQSVLLAFAAAEALLSADAATRRPPATSAREWAAALRLSPLTELVGRYEIARFSTHPVSSADRTAALDALVSLR